MSKWFVYLLRCADDTLYCGITNNLARRLSQHNAGKASKYTRPRRPVSIETYTEVNTKSAALKLEIQVKKHKRSEKVMFLESFKKPTTS